jgi:signal transduction histidine kinase/ActR/RegA family two-component response regulator
VLVCALISVVLLFAKNRNTLKSHEVQLNNKIKQLEGKTIQLTAQTSRLDNAERETRNAFDLKRIFINKINHELRSPMNVIIGQIHLIMEDDSIPANVKETLQKINMASNTLMNFISDELDVFRIEAGLVDMVQREYDVAGLLSDAVLPYRSYAGAEAADKSVVFNLEISEQMPKNLIGDDMRVRQILSKILKNAFIYTKKGMITLKIECLRDVISVDGVTTYNDDACIIFTINDTGVGIREENLANLFSGFGFTDTDSHHKTDVSGLRLRFIKKLAELMDGDITVESEYGVGTTFRVYIRQKIYDENIMDKQTIEDLTSFSFSNQRKRKRLQRSDLSFARVLIVDDIPDNADVVASMLQKYNMKTDYVHSGQEAVDIITVGEPHYNAIFMDYMMPEMDGMEATSLIRALNTEYASQIPIIVMTSAVVGSKQIFLENGFNAFISKPLNVMVLDDIVEEWIHRKQ